MAIKVPRQKLPLRLSWGLLLQAVELPVAAQTRNDRASTLFGKLVVYHAQHDSRQTLLQRQLWLQRALVLCRGIASTVVTAAVIAKYGQAHLGVCPLARRPVIEVMAAATSVFTLAMVLGAMVAEVLLCKGQCLFPTAPGLRSGPLHLSVRLGNVELVQTVWAAGDVDEGRSKRGRGERGRATAVHEAAWCGQVAVLRCLVNLRASVDAADRHGRRPLHLAAEAGQVEVLRVLAELQAPLATVRYKSPSEQSPLMSMHWSSEADIVDYILRRIDASALKARPSKHVLHSLLCKARTFIIVILYTFGTLWV